MIIEPRHALGSISSNADNQSNTLNSMPLATTVTIFI